MTLATRCPACGTAFKVVGDQLRVSSGWVRCGRCQASFDALDHLFRREPAAPASAATPEPVSASVPEPASARTEEPAVAPGVDFVIEPADEAADRSGVKTVAEAVDEPVGEQVVELVADGVSEVCTSPLVQPDLEAGPVPVEEEAPAPATSANEPAAAPLVAPDNPASGWARDPGFRHVPRPRFVRRAEAAARWRHPATRLALTAFAFVLAALLGAQASLLWRDSIAVHWPATRPLLEAACAALKCRLDAPRRIEQLSVESSDLRPLVAGSPVYRLDLTLRNRGDVDLLPPAFDLTLSDSSERVLARRVLTLAELGHPARVVAAGSELVLQADLEAGTGAVAGYTIGIFYP